MHFKTLAVAIVTMVALPGIGSTQQLDLFGHETTDGVALTTSTTSTITYAASTPSLFVQQAVGTNEVTATMTSLYDSATQTPVDLGVAPTGLSVDVIGGTSGTSFNQTSDLVSLSNSAHNAWNIATTDDVIASVATDGSNTLIAQQALSSPISTTTATMELPNMAALGSGISIANQAVGAGNSLTFTSNVPLAIVTTDATSTTTTP